MKEFHLSKLKKEYKLNLNQYLLSKNKVIVKEEEVPYSKLFLTPHQKLKDHYVTVPVYLMGLFPKRSLSLKYKIETVDHTSRKINSVLKGIYIEDVMYQQNHFEFNETILYKRNNFLIKLKLLFFKKVLNKICSKSKRVKVKKQVLEYLDTLDLDLHTLIENFINKNFTKELLFNIQNSEFLKAVVVLNIEKLE